APRGATPRSSSARRPPCLCSIHICRVARGASFPGYPPAAPPPPGGRPPITPPPPMLPALGCVTASAKAVATAASTAFPPLARIEAPASHAGDDVHTTSPSFDETPSSGAL